MADKKTTETNSPQKNKIMECAKQMFLEIGYEKTSVEKIIKKLGISKGAYYHYFRSKADLLHEFMDRQTSLILNEMKEVFKRKDLNGLEKMNGYMEKARDIKSGNVELNMLFLKEIVEGDSQPIFSKYKELIFKVAVPEFAKVLEQGKQEGVFKIEHPDETAEMFFLVMMSMTNHFSEKMIKLQKDPSGYESLVRFYMLFRDIAERILGVKKGSLYVLSEENIKPFISINKKIP